MKTTMFKRISALVLAVILVAAIAVASAGAAQIGDGTASTGDASLTIPKGITVKNTTEGGYYGPAVTYTYTIAPEAPIAGAAVQDTDNHAYPVEIGPADGATLANEGEVAFTSELVSNVTNTGKEITQNLTVNVDLTKFTKPGVYRYKISDITAVSVLYAAGIARPDNYKDDRYLDVYIKNGESGLVVSGYTLTKENLADTSTAKDPGYISSSETAQGEPGTDTYRTYNIRLEKIVTGDMGDKTHAFPFSISVDNGGLTYFYGTDASAVTTETAAASLTRNLKHEDVFYIRGLSPRAMVGYIENNDTSDTYEVTIEGKTDPDATAWNSLVAETSVAPAGNAALTSGCVSTYVDTNSAASVAAEGTLTDYRDVRYTNNLAAVSPTGIVLRFAPFALMLGFAVVLLVVARRSRAKKNETRSI